MRAPCSFKLEHVRLRLDISYDGTDFSGWGTQPRLRTVQGSIEQALMTLLRVTEPVRLVVAGRTDAGVHASGQVAHVDIDEPGDLAKFHKRLSSILKQDADIRIRRVSEAPAGFDARFSPIARRYEYVLVDDATLLDPLDRHRVVVHTKPLDVEAMTAATQTLLGLRDFASFCRPREGSTTIRELQEFTWERLPNGYIVARLKADAFCHSMVRALVGACVSVGQARIGVDELEHIRDAHERTSAVKVMPPHGLNLVEVVYPPESELAARAEQTRARRDLAGIQPME